MGVDVMIVGERGNVLERLENTHLWSSKHWPGNAGNRIEFPILSCIDDYGNTVFNGLQIPGLEDELLRLRRALSAQADLDSLDALVAFANQVKQGSHIYLKFIGD